MKPLNVAFDIDDTLWKVIKTPQHRRGDCPRNREAICNCGWTFKQVPDYEAITVLKILHSWGHSIFAWSAGGKDYAEMIIHNLGLEKTVLVIEKSQQSAKDFQIDLTFDDMDVMLGKVNVFIPREDHHGNDGVYN